MKLSTEVKTALIALFAILTAFWLFNFLKGKNVFKTGMNIYSVYENVDGLRISSPVNINGKRVGVVEDISFHGDNSGKVIVKMLIQSDLDFSKNAVAKIYSSSMLGDKSIILDISKKGKLVSDGDTIMSNFEQSMTNSLIEKINPLKGKLENMIVNMDSTLSYIKRISNPDKINKLTDNINRTFVSFNQTSKKLNGYLNDRNGKIKSIIDNTNNAIMSLSKTTDDLSKINIKKTFYSLDKSISELQKLLAKSNSKNGSLGSLINDKALYNNLNGASSELKKLLTDMRENPKKYVHFSIFGRRNKKPKKKK